MRLSYLITVLVLSSFLSMAVAESVVRTFWYVLLHSDVIDDIT